ncbi:MAG: cytochrome c oxidase accessory protein CcoG [Bdellovibrionales bacterium]|nr:cytochrome c oxidase accessory protein CcoG [Bdellovibrionales bacterium]
MSLGDERLGTLDTSGGRLFLHPAEVKGVFRRYRTYFHIFLLIIFLSIPWLKWNGLQLVLLDIQNRTFVIAGVLFKSHDAPLIFLLLAAGAIGLAVFTSIFGRVWCGWACPQTVFIDAIYRQIEIWVQGKYFARRKLQAQSLSFKKAYKLGLTWALFLLVSILISHSFVAYFVGADRLLEMMRGSPEEHKTAFLFIVGMTSILLFDFGWFREQFCIIACPYGRIQSVLMDSKTTSVLYDEKRGEPRKGLAPMGSRGDCVNCRRCVEVCPTGIDIRRGIQMECIGCTACIDACDDIMTKLKKPKGLIRYTSEFELENKIYLSWWDRLKKPRVLIYGALISIALISFIFLLEHRLPVEITILRKTGAPYTEISATNGQKAIINHITFHLHNQSMRPLRFTLNPSKKYDNVEFQAPMNGIELPANSSQNFIFIVSFSKDLLNKNGNYNVSTVFQVDGENTNFTVMKDITLVGPN